jgi:GrpB-like predicted nucleotidyltransferase (UPF0157 family)
MVDMSLTCVICKEARANRSNEICSTCADEIRDNRTRIVRIVQYDPLWTSIFEDLKHVVESQLGDLAVAVEHVGSTAVPGLAAKPIIDLDVVLVSIVNLPSVISLLGELGYFHQGDLGISNREAFGRDANDVPRLGKPRPWPRHHLYVCSQDSRELRRHIILRDYLRANPSEASKYEALKRQLASRHRYDIDAYVDGKTAFIETILSRFSI